MRERRDELERHGVGLVGVAARADYQARALVADGFGVPLLLDPDNALRAELGIGRLGRLAQLHLRAAPTYLRTWLRARRNGSIPEALWSENDQVPLTVLLTPRPALAVEFDVSWRYVGSRLGDYPTPDDVIAALPRAR